MSVLMSEEKRRVDQFVYQRDAKFALVSVCCPPITNINCATHAPIPSNVIPTLVKST